MGPFILSIGLVTFAYSTILGWSYYGEKAFEYLFGKKPAKIYRLVYVLPSNEPIPEIKSKAIVNK